MSVGCSPSPPIKKLGHRDRREIGGATAVGYVRVRSLTEGGCVAWVLRLVEIGAEGEERCADVMEISRPDSLVDIADLGLTLAEAKLVLAGVQREIVAAQARDHAIRRPGCRRCEGVCRVKDYRQHAIATLFGQVAVRLPRFRCAGCGTTGTGPSRDWGCDGGRVFPRSFSDRGWIRGLGFEAGRNRGGRRGVVRRRGGD